MLDARPIPGGGAATEELLLPGFRLDSCSTGHTIIQGNPLIADDELGLLAKHGLRYVDPDPVAHVAFPDGEQLTHWRDAEATTDEIARFSQPRRRGVHPDAARVGRGQGHLRRQPVRPIGYGPSLDQQLSEHPRGNIWKRRRVLSAWEVIRHEYESRHVQSYMLWQAYQTLVRPDSAGSGLLAYSVVGSRQRRSWTIPVGGSGSLTDALVALPGVVRRHGAVRPDRASGWCSRTAAAWGWRPPTASSSSPAPRCCRASTSSTCWTWRRGRRGTTTGPTASRPTRSVRPAWPSTWPRPSRRSSRSTVRRGRRCRRARWAGPRTSCGTAGTWPTGCGPTRCRGC